MGDNLNGIFANMIQGMGFIGCAPNRVYNMAPPNGGGVEATAEGTELTLHSAAASPLTGLTIYGKSEQRTTTGAQLFDASSINPETVQVNNISRNSILIVAEIIKFVSDADGDAYIGEVQGNLSNIIQVDVEPNIQYTITISDNRLQKSMIRYIDSENEFIGSFIQTGTQYTFTTPEKCVKIALRLGDGNSVSGTQYETSVMLNKGSTALSWEPYTGGAPSPSPDYPQEIKSVGDSGTVNVTLSDGGSQSQTLPVQTPNGLPGIPVDSGGNYTDADGQQWVCDEVDFERGVYVQRVKEISDIAWRLHTGYTVDGSELFSATNITDGLQSGSDQNSAYCSKLIRDNNVLNLNMSGFYQSYGSAYARIKDIGDIDSFLELMQGAVILYQLETPVETPLSPSGLAAYSALRTYSPTTVVSNDAGAWMKVGYKATPQPMTMLARKR